MGVSEDYALNWTRVGMDSVESERDAYRCQVRLCYDTGPRVQAELHLADLLVDFLHKPLKSVR